MMTNNPCATCGRERPGCMCPIYTSWFQKAWDDSCEQIAEARGADINVLRALGRVKHTIYLMSLDKHDVEEENG